jgi:cell pole-organizing protein PopZ
MPPPPPLPHSAYEGAQPPIDKFSTAPIEDTTADLLRPMLRQWLADNMPRMVEKALHIEVAESVKTLKK